MYRCNSITKSLLLTPIPFCYIFIMVRQWDFVGWLVAWQYLIFLYTSRSCLCAIYVHFKSTCVLNLRGLHLFIYKPHWFYLRLVTASWNIYIRIGGEQETNWKLRVIARNFVNLYFDSVIYFILKALISYYKPCST